MNLDVIILIIISILVIVVMSTLIALHNKKTIIDPEVEENMIEKRLREKVNRSVIQEADSISLPDDLSKVSFSKRFKDHGYKDREKKKKDYLLKLKGDRENKIYSQVIDAILDNKVITIAQIQEDESVLHRRIKPQNVRPKGYSFILDAYCFEDNHNHQFHFVNIKYVK